MYIEAQCEHRASVDESCASRGAEGEGIVHQHEAVVDGGEARVAVRCREADFADAVLGKSSRADQLRVNSQVRRKEMTRDVDNGITEHAHAASDDGL